MFVCSSLDQFCKQVAALVREQLPSQCLGISLITAQTFVRAPRALLAELAQAFLTLARKRCAEDAAFAGTVSSD